MLSVFVFSSLNVINASEYAIKKIVSFKLYRYKVRYKMTKAMRTINTVINNRLAEWHCERLAWVESHLLN